MRGKEKRGGRKNRFKGRRVGGRTHTHLHTHAHTQGQELLSAKNIHTYTYTIHTCAKNIHTCTLSMYVYYEYRNIEIFYVCTRAQGVPLSTRKGADIARILSFPSSCMRLDVGQMCVRARARACESECISPACILAPTHAKRCIVCVVCACVCVYVCECARVRASIC